MTMTYIIVSETTQCFITF